MEQPTINEIAKRIAEILVLLFGPQPDDTVGISDEVIARKVPPEEQQNESS